jgi:hypothetical protein
MILLFHLLHRAHRQARKVRVAYRNGNEVSCRRSDMPLCLYRDTTAAPDSKADIGE